MIATMSIVVMVVMEVETVGARWEVEVCEAMVKTDVTETQRYLNLGTSDSYSGEPLSHLPGVGAECLPQENWKELG